VSVVLAEVVLAFGVVVAGVWAFGRYLERQDRRLRQQIDQQARRTRDGDDEPKLVKQR